MRCRQSSLWHEFRAHVLGAFNLWDVPPPAIPTVLVSFRRRSKNKNVGRVIANENDLIDVIKEGHLIKHQEVDMGVRSFMLQTKSH